MAPGHKTDSLFAKLNPNVEEKDFSLFQPDILLPAQYYQTTRSRRYLEPEKKLMAAILEDAIWCFQSYLRARDKGKKQLFHDAEEWITEENGNWLFSFENICEVLGLNPAYLREGLMRWKGRKLAKQSKARVYYLRPKAEINGTTA